MAVPDSTKNGGSTRHSNVAQPSGTVPNADKKDNAETNEPDKESGDMETGTQIKKPDPEIGGEVQTDDKIKIKMSPADRLREKTKNRQINDLGDAMDRMKVFDIAKIIDEQNVVAAPSRTMKADKDSFIMVGRNIGAQQRMSKWTDEQLVMIAKMFNTTIETMQVPETRKSIADPENQFVMKDEKNSYIPTKKAYVSNLNPSQYIIGIGPEKLAATGQNPKFYSDIVLVDKNNLWMLN